MDGTVRGLSLLVWPTGGKSWVLRYQLDGKRRDMGLGPYPEVTLAMARQKALDQRRLVKLDKRDPVAERKQSKLGQAKALTFKAAAEQLLESKRAGWRNAKHAWQWETTLAQLAFPKLGALDVGKIETADVIAVLHPVWTTRTETASRLRQRIEAVLDYATALDKRAGPNPARWKGHLANLLAKPGKVKVVCHHAALDWREAPAFMVALSKRAGLGARALAFTITTAARSGEARGMTWGEIDDADGVWTVPASRTKAGREHRVPLTAAARALLGQRGAADMLVFASPYDPVKPISDMTLIAALRRTRRGDLTVHGFRSTFRDWAGETVNAEHRLPRTAGRKIPTWFGG